MDIQLNQLIARGFSVWYFDNWIDTNGYNVRDGELVRRGGDVKTIRPFEARGSQRILEDFAAVTNVEQLALFCSRHGEFEGERAEYVLDWAKWFAEVMRWRVTGGTAPMYPQLDDDENDFMFVRIDTALRRGGVMQFRLAAESFLAALLMQLAEALSGAGKFKMCVECGRLFMTGTKTRRQNNSKFCSPAHRVKYNNKNRGKD